jgi:transcriptional regulator of acetoin/glycerol metabolism
VLREEGGHVERAAKRLNIPRSTLYQKIKAYGLG